jgi:hypothetical protein
MPTYPEEYLFRKNKKLKLALFQGLCQHQGRKCKTIATIGHHIDKDRSNNSIDNILVVCNPCHAELHSGTPRPHKLRPLRIKRWLDMIMTDEERAQNNL